MWEYACSLTVAGAGTISKGQGFEQRFRFLFVLRGQFESRGEAPHNFARRVAPDTFGKFIPAQQEGFNQLEFFGCEARNVVARCPERRPNWALRSRATSLQDYSLPKKEEIRDRSFSPSRGEEGDNGHFVAESPRSCREDDVHARSHSAFQKSDIYNFQVYSWAASP